MLGATERRLYKEPMNPAIPSAAHSTPHATAIAPAPDPPDDPPPPPYNPPPEELPEPALADAPAAILITPPLGLPGGIVLVPAFFAAAVRAPKAEPLGGLMIPTIPKTGQCPPSCAQ